jgi:phage anti-repressor protein
MNNLLQLYSKTQVAKFFDVIEEHGLVQDQDFWKVHNDNTWYGATRSDFPITVQFKDPEHAVILKLSV